MTHSVLLESPRLGPEIRAESPPEERGRSSSLSSLSSLSPVTSIPQTARPPIPAFALPPASASSSSSDSAPTIVLTRRPLDHQRHQLPERGSAMRVNAHGHLLPPLPTRNFAISPPASPPAEWVSREEDGPNMLPHADDLAARLDRLPVNGSGQYCVFDPDVHYIDSDSDQSVGQTATPRRGSDAPAGPISKKGFIIPPIFVINDDDNHGEPVSPTGPTLQPPFAPSDALTSSPPSISKLRTAMPPVA